MQVNWKRFLRKTHYWASVFIALPVLVIIVSGLFLQLKKDLTWIQPATQRGEQGEPTLAFDEILARASRVPEAGIRSWSDVDRLDVRPSRGLVKVRAKSRWEIQLDLRTGEVLQVAKRRSDLIESIHDGSFFHSKVKLYLFLPAAVALLFMWLTGMYLFLLPFASRRRKAAKLASRHVVEPVAPQVVSTLANDRAAWRRA